MACVEHKLLGLLNLWQTSFHLCIHYVNKVTSQSTYIYVYVFSYPLYFCQYVTQLFARQ